MKTTRNVDKREQHVKKKLTAAVLMLLISCIMTVTSTYAWFTLSTAPEVTGIQTTIGGNGNLEIALATGTTWNNTSDVKTLSSAAASTAEANVTWGNLVDVSPYATDEDNEVDVYGINRLTLSPAALYVSDTGDKVMDKILKVPTYGSDGRTSSLNPANTATYNPSYNNTGAFVMTEDDISDDYGVRAIGISTKRTARQTSYDAAKSSVNNAVSSTQSATSKALVNNGNALANVAVKVALSGSSATFTQTDVDAIESLIVDTQESVKYIEDAIISLIDVAAASSQSQNAESNKIDDSTYLLIKAALSSTTFDMIEATEDTVTIKYGESNDKTFTVTNSTFASIVTDYRQIATDIENALAAIPSEKDSYSWDDIDNSISTLMDMSENSTLTVAGIKLNTLKADPSKYISDVLDNTVVEMGADSGVYSDIAALVGTIKASTDISISYASFQNLTIPATISATNTNPIIPAYLSVFTAPQSAGSDESNEITDIYGYVIDLLFRTNADNSNLLLQTKAIDRIYDNNRNENTMGSGSTMTFENSVASFSQESMIKLIEGIRIVFIDNQGTILGNAGLDTGSTYVPAGEETPVYAYDSAVNKYVVATYVSDTTNDDGYSVAESVTPTHAKLSDGNYAIATHVLKTNYSVADDGTTITADIKMLSADGKSFINSGEEVTKISYKIAEDDEEANFALINGEYVEANLNSTGTDWLSGDKYALDADNNLVKAEYIQATSKETLYPVITALTQNVVSQVSVLVYLDGDYVDNTKVANAATSMTATMNLQFASSAELKPMEYSGLHFEDSTNTESDN